MTNAEKYFRETISIKPYARVIPVRTPCETGLYKSTNGELIYMTYDPECSYFNNVLGFVTEGDNLERAMNKLCENIKVMDYKAFYHENRMIAITWGGIYVVYDPEEDTTTAHAVVQIGTQRHIDKWGNKHEEVIPDCWYGGCEE